jgi:hypothetical protein
MKKEFCFWSVATGPYAEMAQCMVDSARSVGVFKTFHLWTDRKIEGAVCHPSRASAVKERYVQLKLLYTQVRKLKYDYFVWLDADTIFVRHPGDVLRVLHDAPVHASLESNTAQPDPLQPQWGICALPNFTKLMRFKGVRSDAIFTVNAGFWIVHREVIENFCVLAWDFWEFCKLVGYRFGVEPLLAYVTQMLCGNPYLHTLKSTADLWAPDGVGRFSGSVPQAGGWNHKDPFSGEAFNVNPAIIHAPCSKRALVASARARAALSPVTALAS